MRLDTILRVATKILLPFIIVFGLYVHFHAELSPGGGFQAGVIVAAAVILYGLVFGMYAAQRAFPPALAHTLGPLGVLVYMSAGIPALFSGREFLNFGVLMEKAAKGHHYGVIWVEIGVLFAVTGAMLSIFYALVERGR
ncbi:MAG: Na(+)/H(+) antiporter subunit B [Hyphomicrobiaceae bacterium]